MLAKLEDHLKEHIRNVIKNHKKGSNIAKHAWEMDHIIVEVIDSCNYRTCKTLESWHTTIITNSDNNSKLDVTT